MFSLFQAVTAYDYPNSWPSLNQQLNIEGALLQDPIVVAAYAKVKAAITNQTLLNLKPSTYRIGVKASTPIYNENPSLTCYYPENACTSSPNPQIRPDIVSCPQLNSWGITFDDGPTQNIVNGQHLADSTALMALLAQKNIKATFFIVGTNAFKYQNIVTEMYNAGHQLALHTWTHHPLTSLTNEQIVAEMVYNEAIIYNATGIIPTMMRPPYGDIDDRVRAIIQAMGYTIAIWNRDSLDSDQPDQSATSFSNVTGNIKSWFVANQPGIVTLQHDINTFSTSAAIQGLNDFYAAGAPLNAVPISFCQNTAAYKGPAGIPGGAKPVDKSGIPSLPTQSSLAEPLPRENTWLIASLIGIGALLEFIGI